VAERPFSLEAILPDGAVAAVLAEVAVPTCDTLRPYPVVASLQPAINATARNSAKKALKIRFTCEELTPAADFCCCKEDCGV
jgi:hypothetical protein